MTVLMDVTSLLLRQHEQVMTGIDRVEFALARYLCDLAGDIQLNPAFLISGGAGHRLVSRFAMMEALKAMERNRGLLSPPGQQLKHLFDILHELPRECAQIGATRLQARKGPHRTALSRFKFETWASFGEPAFRRFLAENDGVIYYLHASHHGLQWYERFRWIANNPIQATFFVHDLIPIDFPQFCSEGAYRSHKLKLETMARLGHNLISNSRYTAGRLRAYLDENAYGSLPVDICRLGTGPLVEVSAKQNKSIRKRRCGHPYYVCVGTIEGRKNIALLLDVWRQLAARVRSENMPRLVIAGGRGWSNDEVLYDLENMTDIGSYIVEVNGLSDMELRNLVAHAEALLAPSYVEGFGLAPAEALARGVPVIASDIDAHRELFAPGLYLVDPAAISEWLRLIEIAPNQAALSKKVNWSDFARGVIESTIRKR